MSGTSRCIAIGLALAAVAVASCSDPTTSTNPGTTNRLINAGGNRSAFEASVTPASLDWQDQARALIGANNLSPLAAARVLASLSVAQYHAVSRVGDYDESSQLASNGIGAGGRNSLEERRGAVAGASVEVLSFFFPAAAASLEQRVLTDGESRPGNVHPAYAQGLLLGRKEGVASANRARNDHFTAPWTGSVPTGPGKWIANGPPAGATFGGVTPYFLTSGQQFRPAPPPPFGSPEFLADRDEIRALSDTRTPAQLASAIYWNFPTGTFTPVGFWNVVAAEYVKGHALDEQAATRAFALMHAAMMDALIGCWEAKYFYWTIRPSQADPLITLAFALPNHPSYPSGHSCVSAAAATVLSHVFPEQTSELDTWVNEAGRSRMYAGIHYRFDITSGAALGAAVGRWAIAHANLLE